MDSKAARSWFFGAYLGVRAGKSAEARRRKALILQKGLILDTLLAERKLRNYLLYAVGEILLVVIGILIALQINLIQNKEIRDVLTNWPAWLGDAKEVESWILHDVRQLEDYLHNRYSSSDILRTFPIARNAIKYPNNFHFDREIILNDYNFENHIIQLRFNRISHIAALRRFENGILKSLEIFEEEINEN